MANIETVALDTRYFAEAAAPGTPDTGKAVIYVKTDGKLYLKDDAGTETDLTSGGSVTDLGDLGDVTVSGSETDGQVLTSDGLGGFAFEDATGGMSNPMTTSQDIIVGGASGTPGRLAVGSEGQVLTVSSGNVAWAAASGGGGVTRGTTFPGTPSTGDRYQRSDINEMIFVYDGTDWVSEQVRYIQWWYRFNTGSNTDHTSVNAVSPWPEAGVASLAIKAKLNVSCLINGTCDASNYWTLQPLRYNGSAWAALTNTVTVDTKTAAGSLAENNLQGAWTKCDAVAEMGIRATKTGSPGGLFGTVGMAAKLIAT